MWKIFFFIIFLYTYKNGKLFFQWKIRNFDFENFLKNLKNFKILENLEI